MRKIKKRVNYRIKESHLKALNKWCKREGLSQNKAVEGLIEDLLDRYGFLPQENILEEKRKKNRRQDNTKSVLKKNCKRKNERRKFERLTLKANKKKGGKKQ